MVKVRTTKHLLAGVNLVFPSTNVVLAFVTRLEANSAVREVIKSLVDNVAKMCINDRDLIANALPGPARALANRRIRSTI